MSLSPDDLAVRTSARSKNPTLPVPAPVPDPKLIAFYLPQFHPIPENDAWWGKGFTEWRNVVRARPNFKGHYQPHLPADLGFYDLRVPETRIEQAELARHHGIHGFCYYYYWFGGRRLLARPLDEMAATGTPDFPFCVCWANENWTRRWDGGNDDILIGQTYSADNDRRLVADLLPLFEDRRYIRVGTRPLLLVYRAGLLPSPRESAERFRETARRSGSDEPFLAAVEYPGMPDPREMGFDAAVEFPPHGMRAQTVTAQIERINPAYQGDVWDYISAAQNAIARPAPAYPLFRGVMTGWDNTPRLANNAQIFVNSHPDNYRRWLAAIVGATRSRNSPDMQLVFVNAWNEWAEGCHLEPDQAFGRGYLEATRAALATPG
jgi:lipopolysaccharide biosynthesis protein